MDKFRIQFGKKTPSYLRSQLLYQLPNRKNKWRNRTNIFYKLNTAWNNLRIVFGWSNMILDSFIFKSCVLYLSLSEMLDPLYKVLPCFYPSKSPRCLQRCTCGQRVSLAVHCNKMQPLTSFLSIAAIFKSLALERRKQESLVKSYPAVSGILSLLSYAM